MKAPDFAEPIYGWRVWRIARTSAGHRLWSVVYDDVWSPSEPLTACCHSESHAAPGPSCGCGVYAMRSMFRAARYLTGRDDGPVVDRAIGVVALWGLVFEGASGWRASFAHPHRLWVRGCRRSYRGADNRELVDDLSVYGAAVTVLEGRDVSGTLTEIASDPSLPRHA